MAECVAAFVQSETIIGTNTTLTLPTIPYEDGDVLVLAVMHRSALTTPTGWTLDQTVGPVSGSAFSQRVSTLSRVMSGSGTIGQAVVQASSGRLALAILRFKSSVSVAARADLAQATTKSTVATVTSNSSPSTRLLIWCVAQELWGTSGVGAVTPWASSPNMPSVIWTGLSTSNQPRLGVFVDALASGARTLTPDTTQAAATDYFTLAVVEVTGKTLAAANPTVGILWPV